MTKNYDEGMYLIGIESGGKTYLTEDGRNIQKLNSARKEPEEVYDIIGGISADGKIHLAEDFVDDNIIKSKDSEGYTILGVGCDDEEEPKTAKENIIKQIKFGPFLITIQRRMKQK